MIALLKRLLSPPIFEDPEETRIAGLLNTILLAILVMIGLLFGHLFTSGNPISGDLKQMIPWVVSLGMALIVVGLWFLMRRGQVRLASALLCLTLWGAVTMSVYTPYAGVRDSSTTAFLLTVAVATLLLGSWAAIVFTILSGGTIYWIYQAEMSGALAVSSTKPLGDGYLITYMAVLGLMGVVLYLAAQSINRSLRQARLNEQAQSEANRELQATQEQLQAQVNQLTQATRSLEANTAITRHLTTILNFDELIAAVVDQLSQTFNYYHVQIYLFDRVREYLVLTGASGRVGQLLLERGDRILRGSGIIGQVVQSGREMLLADTTQERAWQPASLLRETKSEAIIPITLGEQILGVLDVHQNEVNGLTEVDMTMLRSVANQVAIAIHNAQSFAQLETSLAEAREVQAQYVEQSWEQVRSRQGGNRLYRYQRTGLEQLADQVRQQIRQLAWQQDQPTLLSEVSVEAEVEAEAEAAEAAEGQSNGSASTEEEAPRQTTESLNAIVAPVLFGGQTIGALQMHRLDQTGHRRQWSEADLEFVQSVLDQVALAAENLRLFETTREQAGREQVIRQITDNLRAAPNLDTLLKTATQELGKHLALRHALLEVGLEKETD